MNDKLILKNNLKKARAEKNLSQSALAEMVGVSRIQLVPLKQDNSIRLLNLHLSCVLHSIKNLKIYFILRSE